MDADRSRDPRSAEARHRPRAAPLRRRARHGPLDRDLRAGDVAVTISLTTAGCPIRNHVHRSGHARGLDGRGCRRRHRRLRRPVRQREGRPCRRRSAARSMPAGALAQVQERPVRRLRQGRRRQVDADIQSRRRADARRQVRRDPRRRRLGVLDPTHVRPRQRASAGVTGAQDPADAGARREDHVDRLLRRGGRRRRLARADAAQGADAVPRGRRVGRAGLPARRSAAGHGRRLDDARPAAVRRRSS